MERAARIAAISAQLAVVTLAGAAALPMTRLFRPGPLGGVVLLTIVASVSVSMLLRRIEMPALLSWIWSMLAFVWFATLLFHRGTLWGPFPSLESLRQIGESLGTARIQAAREVAPVTPTTPLLLLVSAGVWLTAWLADIAIVVLRNPLLAAASGVPLFAMPGAIVKGERLWLDAGAFVAAAAAAAYVEERTHALEATPAGHRAGWRPGAAARLGLGVVVLAVVAGPALPGFGAPPGAKVRSGRGGTSVSSDPIVAIKPTLDNSPVRTVFVVSASEPAYSRLTALDRFDGERWTQSPQPRAGLDLGGVDVFEGSRLGVLPAITLGHSRPLWQEVTIFALHAKWLPAAFAPVSVSGVGADIEVSARGLVSHVPLRQGMRYAVLSRVPDVDEDDLARAPAPSSIGERFLRLPELPREVREIAERVAGSEPTAYGKARALQDYLRTFTYDENIAAGHSYDTLLEFLTESRRGYCEQFAASMAVLARSLGIPSRVALGFGIGEPDGEHRWRITTRDAHTWPELYFEGIGWVPFEPTPRAETVAAPAYAVPSPTPSAPAASPTASERETSSPGAQSRRPEEQTGNGRDRDVPRIAGARTIIAVVAGALLLLVAGTLLVSAMLRRRRIARAPTPRDASLARYADFLSWCAAVGLGRKPGETPSEHAARIAEAFSDAGPPVTTLGSAVTEVLYAHPDLPGEHRAGRDVGTLTGEVRAAISAHLPPRRRALAAAGWGRWRLGR